jgi:hypothetical protein
VNNPSEGNPDILYVNLKSKFVFVSEEYKKPLKSTMMSFEIPLQVFPN